ncbi:hypothetical protein BGY98DRAFT_1010767 [Russula aff. rugulosa BPL654]|nr:hypothetical protein BGY98DRAFT_1010767 [Russula aff. rugulosa BPL654]
MTMALQPVTNGWKWPCSLAQAFPGTRRKEFALCTSADKTDLCTGIDVGLKA